ncbi:MAG: cytidylate kinase-like family protein [Deltaproteobacteria bacterium]|nr:cytidylate kinase-like family protein [Deltaproteobacteria bacterium]
MKKNTGETTYVPGFYGKKRPSVATSIDDYYHEWEKRQLELKKEKPKLEIPPTICFSRKIGVGALEVADILAKKINYRVFDREILDKIAGNAKVSKKTVTFFDEHYPGNLSELGSMLFGEKSFIKSDYTRYLFNTVSSIACIEPSIFVGRGTHLILPRDRVLAVRLVGDRAHRIKRLARILKITEQEADSKLNSIDKEQRSFFKKVYGKKEASPYEFDMVINFEYMNEPQWAADIVEKAFEVKFGNKIVDRSQ